MPARTVDLVGRGPPSPDLYDPAAPVWALAGALVARGHSIRVAFPSYGDGPPPPARVDGAPFPAVTPHVGTAEGDAELSRSASRQLRSNADAIVRLPMGLGPLGHHVAGRSIVSFVSTLWAEAPDVPAAAAGTAGKVRAWFRWGRDGGVRRLEQEALGEATAVCAATESIRSRLKDDYGLAGTRSRLLPAPVPIVPDVPSRSDARRQIGVPDDVNVVVALPPAEPAEVGRATTPVVEASRRLRPLFPGSRLGIVGQSEPPVPWALALPSREAPAVAAAVAAADIVVATSAGPVPDPGLVLALRQGIATVVRPAVDLGPGSEAFVRRSGFDDPGELASILAELIADLEGRQQLGRAAAAAAGAYDPDRIAGELETFGALGRA